MDDTKHSIIDQMYQERRSAGRDKELVRWVLSRETRDQIELDADRQLSLEILESKTIMGLPFVVDETLSEGTWKLETRDGLLTFEEAKKKAEARRRQLGG